MRDHDVRIFEVKEAEREKSRNVMGIACMPIMHLWALIPPLPSAF